MLNLKKLVYRYIYPYPGIRISGIINRAYFRWYLRIKNVHFTSTPEITGKFKLINNGKFRIGVGARFYNTFISNPIGISKYTTVCVEDTANLIIGDNCGFTGVSVYCASSITIGNNLFCGANTNIWDTDFHPLSYVDRNNNLDHLAISKPILIGNNVFIGANTTILKGVTIGDRSVIGAGSVVTRNIPEDEIWAGNPAKFIKNVV